MQNWYHNWHNHPRHKQIHWLVFCTVIIFLFSFLAGELLYSYNYNLSLAQTNSEFYASPTGTISGDGSINNPWDLQTALSGGKGQIKPGNTLWLRNGTYQGTFTSNLAGSPSSPIIVRQYPGERATIDSALASNTTALLVYGSDTWYWGFEITNTNTNRYGNGSRAASIDVHGPRTKFINMLIHDGGIGVGFWSSAPDAELYGNIIYNVGVEDSDRGHGHSIYVQNQSGIKRIINNILFNSHSFGIHAYTEGGKIDNIQLEGNTAFNHGVLSQISGAKANYLYWGPQALNPLMKDNFGYYSPFSSSGRNIDVKRCTNGTFTGNYMAGGTAAVIANCNGTFTGNTLYGSTSGVSSLNNNISSSNPTGKKVFVRPNIYEQGRANITVYNWDKSSTVDVDVSSAGLSSGQQFEIRDAQNYFGNPVASGIYNGLPISIPMTGLTAARPIGNVSVIPSHTAPEFGAFIIMPSLAQPQLPTPIPQSSNKTGSAQISSFTSNISIVSPSQSLIFSWSTSGVSKLILNPGNIDVTGLTSYALPPNRLPQSNTLYNLTAEDISGQQTISTVFIRTVSNQIPSRLTSLWVGPWFNPTSETALRNERKDIPSLRQDFGADMIMYNLDWLFFDYFNSNNFRSGNYVNNIAKLISFCNARINEAQSNNTYIFWATIVPFEKNVSSNYKDRYLNDIAPCFNSSRVLGIHTIDEPGGPIESGNTGVAWDKNSLQEGYNLFKSKFPGKYVWYNEVPNLTVSQMQGYDWGDIVSIDYYPIFSQPADINVASTYASYYQKVSNLAGSRDKWFIHQALNNHAFTGNTSYREPTPTELQQIANYNWSQGFQGLSWWGMVLNSYLPQHSIFSPVTLSDFIPSSQLKSALLSINGNGGSQPSGSSSPPGNIPPNQPPTGLPAPNHPIMFGYYHVDAQYGDFKNEVRDYTNTQIILEDSWIRPPAVPTQIDTQNLNNAFNETIALGHKIVYLTAKDPNDYQQSINLIRPFWQNIDFIYLADEPNWDKATTEANISNFKNLVSQAGLSQKQIAINYTPQQIQNGTSYQANNLDIVGFETYMDSAVQNDPGIVTLINNQIDASKQKIGNKKMFIVIQGYNRNGAWTNLNSLIDIQIPPYLKSYDDPNVIGLFIFTYARPGGTQSLPILKIEHQKIGAAILGTTPGGGTTGGQVPITNIQTDNFGPGAFPDVMWHNGKFWMAVQLGPRGSREIQLYSFNPDLSGRTIEKTFTLSPNALAFPRLSSHAGTLWLAYRDGDPNSEIKLWRQDTDSTEILGPGGGNDPVAIGEGVVAWQDRSFNISMRQLTLTGGPATSGGQGAPTGLSRISAGRAITIDQDNNLVPWGTRAWVSGLLTLAEGPVSGVLGEIISQRFSLFEGEESFTPHGTVGLNGRYAAVTWGAPGVRITTFDGPTAPINNPPGGNNPFGIPFLPSIPSDGLFTFPEFIQFIFTYSLSILGIAVFVMIFYAGVLWFTAAGNLTQVAKARSMIFNAIIGAILLVSSVIILNTLNPDLTGGTLYIPPLGGEERD